MNEAEQKLQRGIHAFMSFRFEEAAALLLPLAEQGEVEAQKLIARLYFSGNGVEQNKAKYQYWLEQAAAQGDRQSKAKLKRIQKKQA